MDDEVGDLLISDRALELALNERAHMLGDGIRLRIALPHHLRQGAGDLRLLATQHALHEEAHMHRQTLIVKIALAICEMRLIPNDLHDLVHEPEPIDSLTGPSTLLLRVDEMQGDGSGLGVAERPLDALELVIQQLDRLLAHLELAAIVLADLPGQRVFGKKPLLCALVNICYVVGKRDVDGISKANPKCALSIIDNLPGKIEIPLRNRVNELVQLALLLDGREHALDLVLGNLAAKLNVADAQTDDHELAAIVILRNGNVIVERLGEPHGFTPPLFDIVVCKTKNPG